MRVTGIGEQLAADNGAKQQNHSHNAGPDNPDLTGRALEHVNAHQDGDRDGHPDGENSPRAVRQSIDDNDAKSGQRDQQNEEQRDHGDQAGVRADFGACDVSQRASLVPHRCHQHGEVVNAAAENGAKQDPDKSGSEAELRSQSWSHQRTRAGNGCEVMAEQHPLRRRHVVVAVFINVRREWCGCRPGQALWRR